MNRCFSWMEVNLVGSEGLQCGCYGDPSAPLYWAALTTMALTRDCGVKRCMRYDRLKRLIDRSLDNAIP